MTEAAFPPELQATAITLVNVLASTLIFKLKQYKDNASRANKRALAVTEAVDMALRDDGTISTGELRRIKAVAERANS